MAKTERTDAQSRRIAEAYDALPADQLKQVLLIEYRCPGRCLLLRVWNSPDGRFWYTPRYRLSPHKAISDTAESARKKRTEDGFRMWRARGGSFDELLDDFSHDPRSGGLTLTCDHVREDVLTDQLAGDAARGMPGHPTARLIHGHVGTNR